MTTLVNGGPMEHATNPENIPSLQAIIEEFLEDRR